MAQTTGRNLNPPQSTFVNKDGTLSYDGYQYLLSLQAANSSSTATVSNALTATGTNQATALALTSDWNEVTNVAAGSGVLLQALQAGQSQIVFNQGAHPLNVYPPPGGTINALAVNAPFALAAGSRQTFDFTSSSQIRT